LHIVHTWCDLLTIVYINGLSQRNNWTCRPGAKMSGLNSILDRPATTGLITI